MHGVRLKFLQRIIFFVFALGVLIVLNLIWIIPTLRATRSSVSTLALVIAERASTDVTFSLKTMQRELEKTAEEIAFEPNRKKNAIERLLKHNPAIRSIGLANRDGKETFLLDRFRFITPKDFRDHSMESYVARALKGTASFGDVFVSSELEPYITLAVPISRAGNIDQVIVGDINMRDLFAAIYTPKTIAGHVYVVDKTGYQIMHPNLSELLRRPDFSDRPIVSKVVRQHVIANGLAPEDEYINEQGERTFTVGIPILVADLSLFFEQPRSQALAQERRAIAIAIGTIIGGITLLLFIFRTTLRLQQLTKAQTQLLLENDQSAKMLVRRDMELSDANARLLELDKTKSEFVSVAAHQLRTPLTGLRWSYHALLDGDMGPLTEDQKKNIRDGLHATLQMITLINDLLSVARIEEGRFGFTFTLQSLEPIIAQSLTRFEKIARDKAVTLIFQPAPPTSVGVPAKLPRLLLDAEKIGMVIDNLLDNALKYTSPGGSVILRAANEKTHVSVEVEDTGIGIPKDQMRHLFTKFFRASNAMLFQTSGNGLGLYVAKNIVETHGGDMFVESVEGKGSKFTFTLPVKQAS